MSPVNAMGDISPMTPSPIKDTAGAITFLSELTSECQTKGFSRWI
jgi:hypothetical protein